MERLQKVIAQAGIASRRKAEELIKDGKVKVNGEVKKELGTKVSESDKVEVNNKPIEKETKEYYLLNNIKNIRKNIAVFLQIFFNLLPPLNSVSLYSF